MVGPGKWRQQAHRQLSRRCGWNLRLSPHTRASRQCRGATGPHSFRTRPRTNRLLRRRFTHNSAEDAKRLMTLGQAMMSIGPADDANFGRRRRARIGRADCRSWPRPPRPVRRRRRLSRRPVAVPIDAPQIVGGPSITFVRRRLVPVDRFRRVAWGAAVVVVHGADIEHCPDIARLGHAAMPGRASAKSCGMPWPMSYSVPTAAIAEVSARLSKAAIQQFDGAARLYRDAKPVPGVVPARTAVITWR